MMADLLNGAGNTEGLTNDFKMLEMAKGVGGKFLAAASFFIPFLKSLLPSTPREHVAAGKAQGLRDGLRPAPHWDDEGKGVSANRRHSRLAKAAKLGSLAPFTGSEGRARPAARPGKMSGRQVRGGAEGKTKSRWYHADVRVLSDA